MISICFILKVVINEERKWLKAKERAGTPLKRAIQLSNPKRSRRDEKRYSSQTRLEITGAKGAQ